MYDYVLLLSYELAVFVSEKHSMCSFSAEFHHILCFFHRIECDDCSAESSIFEPKNTTVPFKNLPTEKCNTTNFFVLTTRRVLSKHFVTTKKK